MKFSPSQTITEDVIRQTEREKQLQAKYADLKTELQKLDPASPLLKLE